MTCATDRADHSDLLTLLNDAQTSVRRLLDRYADLRAGSASSGPARAGLVRRLCAELAVHLHVEEELLYPCLRASAPEHTAPVDQAEVEHECLRQLMDRLRDMPPDEPSFDARVVVLAEIFSLHVQRELLHLIPRLDGRLPQGLAPQMARRRDDLLAQLAQRPDRLRFENEDADPVGEPPR